MNTEKMRYYAYLTVSVLGGAVLVFVFMKYLFFPVLPFLIAWGIAFSLRPPSRFLARKLKLPERAVSVALTLAVTLSVIAILCLGIWQLSREVWHFLSGFGSGEFSDFLSDLLSSGGIFSELFGSLGEQIGGAIYEFAASLLSKLAGVVSSWVGAVPGLLLFVLMTVISSVYFALDLKSINRAVSSILPKGVLQTLVRFKNGFLSFAVRYLRAYLYLMLITFAVLLLGFTVLRVNYALLLAVLIAFLDLLPILGVGTALVPWSVVSLIMGDTFLGVGLLILLLVHEVIRQFAEPKILGKHLGVHPVITLVLLYVGYSVFGFTGLILVPVFTVVLDITLGKKNSPEVT